MNSRISRAPTWLLFVASLFPFLLMGSSIRIWSISLAMSCIFLSLWVFTIAKSLFGKVKDGNGLDFRAFKRVLIGGCLFALFQFGYTAFQQNENPVWNWMLVIFVIGQFWMLYAYLVAFNFVSKAIATVERGEPAKFDQYASYFVCLFFFPVGIWFMHPRIKAILVS